MRSIPAIFILSLVFLTSCKNSKKHNWSELPAVVDLSNLQHTEFAPTIESPITGNKNVVYATAFLYAWEQVRQHLNAPIALTDKNSNQFRLVNQSTSYQNTLTEDEYSAEAEVVDGVIITRAFFNKTLPFPSKLQKLDQPISFNKTKISAFGMIAYDEEVARFTEILYYKDDNNFVLKLTPKDSEHHILLAKGIDNVPDLSSAVEQVHKLIDTGKIEKVSTTTAWKYTLNRVDVFAIPTIKFNIETNYADIEGQAFTSNSKPHHVEEAYQRTGFILNENGAVVESEAYALTDSVEGETIKISPKKMVFDRPFFIIIKRSKSTNPYFVMYVQNPELLTKE